jgi:hypothetical protein
MKKLGILTAIVLALAGLGWTFAAGTATAAAPQNADPDTTGAALWAHLRAEAYQASWALYPGTTALYEGTEPHGMLLTTYVNEIAAAALGRDVDRLPDGAIVVKENYMPNGELAAVTVMYKRAGYNPDHNDWFFSKHLPDGSLDRAPNGMAMEGRVPGCQACHSARRENDYLYTGNP